MMSTKVKSHKVKFLGNHLVTRKHNQQVIQYKTMRHENDPGHPQIPLRLHNPEISSPASLTSYIDQLYGVRSTKPWNPPLRFADNPPDFGVRYNEFPFFFFFLFLFKQGMIKRTNNSDRRGSSNY